ncbi:unnamed protein product [Amaranthus hypochondriacus]
MAGVCTTPFIILMITLIFSGFCACSNAQDVTCSSQVPTEEVEALRQIAREVGKLDWNCSADPCSNRPNERCWNSTDSSNKKYANLVNCTCHDGTLHISHIFWKVQKLAGVLPRSLAKLPYIQTIDFSRNVLTGTIPPEWTKTKLEFVSLLANRLSGRIPKYLGNISTLTQLSLESNHFIGTVPAELGNLRNLTNLTLSDNQLTGPLPLKLTKLTNLFKLQLSSNNFSGSLPDHFENYPQLQTLDLIGSGFEGPIPSSISSLYNLKILRISDLGGEDSEFPNLQKLKKLDELVLRSCNITGKIPDYFGNFQNLKFIDFSFNKLTGPVPFYPQIEYLYLTSNMLNGSIPEWIAYADDTRHIDISYNYFNDTHSCDRDNLNLYRCNARQKSLDSSECLKGLRCSKTRYSLHINCGGQEIRFGKSTFEKDNKTNGAAMFFHEKAYWGFSSSGTFWKADNVPTFIAQNTSMLRINDTEADLYKEARHAATSLTYYGRCLAKGNYTVTLYFSEIVFTDGNTYTSLGRRVFDIFIQEKLYAKDFDIVKEANGTNKAFKLTFTNVSVTNYIEIRFYYGGKGSTQIPFKGYYGPLISAISVESQFNPPFDWKIVMWVLIGAAACVLGIALGYYWWKRRMAHIQSREQELRTLNPQIGIFTYNQIKAACNNFNADSKLGEGGFGSVYKGTLSDGTLIAVKQLSSKSSQGNREFVNEIGMISSLCHPNLVRLCGCCVDTSQLLLVYEFMENKDLGHALFSAGEGRSRFDWRTRKKICIGIARGLVFLHEESRLKIVHRDIKATNVLLDRDLNPKISDFGLAKLNEEEISQISTRVAGTIGYMAPEYALWGYLTPKVDVYSFGVLILEVMAGRSNMKFQPNEEHYCLLDKAFFLKQKGDLLELMDPTLGSKYNKDEASKIIQIALLCTNPSPALRPTMSEVLSMLEGNTEVQELILEPNSSYSREWIYQHSSKNQLKQVSEAETQSLIHSSEAPSVELSSSKSIYDSYPVDSAP